MCEDVVDVEVSQRAERREVAACATSRGAPLCPTAISDAQLAAARLDDGVAKREGWD